MQENVGIAEDVAELEAWLNKAKGSDIKVLFDKMCLIKKEKFYKTVKVSNSVWIRMLGI